MMLFKNVQIRYGIPARTAMEDLIESVAIKNNNVLPMMILNLIGEPNKERTENLCKNCNICGVLK